MEAYKVEIRDRVAYENIDKIRKGPLLCAE